MRMGGGKVVDFNIVIPMPESLNIVDGSENNYAIYVYLSKRMSISIDALCKNTVVQKLLMDGTTISGKYRVLNLNDIITKMNPTPEQIEKYYNDGKILVSNYENYGYTTWYDWCINNWGSKWNARTEKVEEIDEENYYIIFNTPWSYPKEWLRKLASMCVPFELEWIEEQGFHGEIISEGIGDRLTYNNLPLVDYWDTEE